MHAQSAEMIRDNVEAGFSLPDPGDWDPNYSDELLLQEDGSDESCLTTEFGRSVNLGSTEPWSGFGRLNHVSNSSSPTIMQSGKLEVEIEVKSNADKFWSTIRDSAAIFPKAFPNDYKSIEILEGDGKAAGSIRQVAFGEGSPLVKITKEKIDAVDDSERTLTYSVIDGDLLKYFKHLKGHLSVTPKGDGSLVKWSSEYEKDSQEVPEPEIIKEFAVQTFLKVDDYILNA